MATGANIQQGRGREVSNLPPQVDLRTGEAQAWDSARRVFDQFAEAAKPDLIRRAQARGAEEGMAVAEGGEMPKRGLLFGGDVAAARTQALEGTYRARIRSDIEAREDALRREYRYDPEGYEAASREMASTFIQNAPPDFAVDVEMFVNGRVASGLSAVANARVQRDEQEANQALAVRAGTLEERIIALASNGQQGSAEWNEALAERAEVQNLRENNPAILYSAEQRAADDEKMLDGATTAVTTREAIAEYQANGRGPAGFAAATRFLNDEVLQGEAYRDMPPDRRQRVYRDSMAQLRDFSAVDREERKVEEERERAERAARREAVGDYRLRILLGEATEADVLADDTLDDADKAGLVSSARAAARREAADARRDQALEAANARGTYADLRDRADAGLLSQSELADHLNAELITQGQAATLRDRNDKQLKPLIDDVLAPTTERLQGRRNSAQQRMIAERAATLFARENPNATLEQRIAAGNAIRDRVTGSTSQGRPTTGPQANAGRAAAVRAANARIQAARDAGRPFSAAEEARIRNEALND